MLKNLKRLFVGTFILICSSVCLLSSLTLASVSSYPGSLEDYNSDEAITAYKELSDFCQQTLLPQNSIVPPDLLENLQNSYFRVCKSLFYLLKDYPENYDKIFCQLNYVALIISELKINLRSPLVSECYEEDVQKLFDKVSTQCGLKDFLPYNKKLNLFDAILIYSYVSHEPPLSIYHINAMKDVLRLNGMSPETFLNESV